MKKIIAISLITIGLLLISFNFARSFFYSKAFFKGIKFKVGDFVSPPKVVLEKNYIVTLNNNLQINWSKVEDFKNYSEPIFYRFSFLGREFKVTQNQYDLSLSSYIPGEYLYKVKACDQLNNCSLWSEEGKIVILETVLAGDSEKNNNLFQISNINSTNEWNSNYLKLSIDNSYDILQMNFQYISHTVESLAGFDQTKLLITVNDKIVFLENNTKEIWEDVQISLSQFSEDSLEIKFYSGNQGDNKFSSWAEVKEIEFLSQLETGVSTQELKVLSDQAKDLGILY